jgi:tetratricopeptide (TPR) repeat protein
VAEENWPKALREFKRALSSKPSPEAHYVLGCLYYQLGRDSMAVRHLSLALEMDQNYSEAFYVLGLVHRRSGHEELARKAFDAAAANDSRKRQRKVMRPAGEAAPLFDMSRSKSRRLLTGGDLRIAKAVRDEALKAFAP